MNFIAILLTVHNRKDKTLECLKHLFAQQAVEGYQWDVYLTDDGCTDGTPEVVAEQYPLVHIVDGDGTLFWNRGMQKAWKAAANARDYDFYLWLNDDTYINPDTINHLIDCSKSKEHQAVICGFLCSAFDSYKTSYGGRANGRQLNPNGMMQEVSLINGNVVLVPKPIYEKIGTLDPCFPHAIGDFDYGLRAMKQGFRLFTTTKYVGTCELNSKLPRWCYTDTPLAERLKALYSPLGNAHPRYFFVYEFRHFGFLQAIKHYVTIHLRALFPSLWRQ